MKYYFIIIIIDEYCNFNVDPYDGQVGGIYDFRAVLWAVDIRSFAKDPNTL